MPQPAQDIEFTAEELAALSPSDRAQAKLFMARSRAANTAQTGSEKAMMSDEPSLPALLQAITASAVEAGIAAAMKFQGTFSAGADAKSEEVPAPSADAPSPENADGSVPPSGPQEFLGAEAPPKGKSAAPKAPKPASKPKVEAPAKSVDGAVAKASEKASPPKVDPKKAARAKPADDAVVQSSDEASAPKAVPTKVASEKSAASPSSKADAKVDQSASTGKRQPSETDSRRVARTIVGNLSGPYMRTLVSIVKAGAGARRMDIEKINKKPMNWTLLAVKLNTVHKTVTGSSTPMVSWARAERQEQEQLVIDPGTIQDLACVLSDVLGEDIQAGQALDVQTVSPAAASERKPEPMLPPKGQAKVAQASTPETQPDESKVSKAAKSARSQSKEADQPSQVPSTSEATEGTKAMSPPRPAVERVVSIATDRPAASKDPVSADFFLDQNEDLLAIEGELESRGAPSDWNWPETL